MMGLGYVHGETLDVAPGGLIPPVTGGTWKLVALSAAALRVAFDVQAMPVAPFNTQMVFAVGNYLPSTATGQQWKYVGLNAQQSPVLQTVATTAAPQASTAPPPLPATLPATGSSATAAASAAPDLAAATAWLKANWILAAGALAALVMLAR